MSSCHDMVTLVDKRSTLPCKDINNNLVLRPDIANRWAGYFRGTLNGEAVELSMAATMV